MLKNKVYMAIMQYYYYTFTLRARVQVLISSLSLYPMAGKLKVERLSWQDDRKGHFGQLLSTF